MTAEFTDQDRLILARSRLWTADINKLLRRWKNTAANRRRSHLDNSISSNKKHYFFGLPAAILSTLIATGILSTFRDCAIFNPDVLPLSDSCIACKDWAIVNADLLTSGTTCDIDQWIRLMIGIIGIVCIVLTALITFMNYQQDSQEHKQAADDYDSLVRQIDGILITPPTVRGDPVSTLQDIRSEFSKYVRKHPTLSDDVNIELTYEVLTPEELQEHKPTPPSRNIFNRKRSRSTGSLLSTNTANEREFNELFNKEASKEYSDSIDNYLAKQNDHDTDDEHEEVVIGFDLDEEMCYSPSVAAQTVAILNSRQESDHQKSVQKALQFELQRLTDHSIPYYANSPRNTMKRSTQSYKTMPNTNKPKTNEGNEKANEVIVNIVNIKSNDDDNEKDHIHGDKSIIGDDSS